MARDPLAVSEPDSSEWIAPTWVSADRERVDRGGLAAFARASWRIVEPAQPLEWDWHLDEVCTHLEAWYLGDCRNLLINIPPGMTKTMLTGVIAPAWVWTRRPAFKLLSASYSDKEAINTSRRTLELVKSRWYCERWGSILGRHTSESDYRTLAGGLRFATGVGTRGTGRHGDAFQIDDPIKAKDAEFLGEKALSARLESVNSWLSNTAASRAVNKEAFRMGLVMQRLHESDASAYMQKTIGVDAHLMLPALFDPDRRSVTRWGGDRRRTRGEPLAPRRYNRAAWDREAKRMGGWDSLVASGQLQQQPTPPGGAIFKAECFQYFDASALGSVHVPGAPRFQDCYSVLSVDPTFKDGNSNDFVALEVWGAHDGKFYLWHSNLERRGFQGTLDAIKALLQVYPCTTILIEDKANGSAITETMRTAGIPNVETTMPGVPKVTRAGAAAVYYNAMQVFHAAGAPWLEEKEAHLKACPRGVWDGVDTTSQAILFLAARGLGGWGEWVDDMARDFRAGPDAGEVLGRMLGVGPRRR